MGASAGRASGLLAAAPPTGALVLTPPHVVQQLYQLLKDVHELFTAYGLPYWIEGGTLLGAVRHGGLIPWDEDADIQILEADEPTLLDLAPFLASSLGYTLLRVEPWGYKIFPSDGAVIPGGYAHRFPFLDVFVVRMTTSVGTLASSRTCIRGDAWDKCHFTADEHSPPRAYKFGPIVLMGPADPTGYLDRCYGATWSTHASHTFDHANERDIPSSPGTVDVPLRQRDLGPALPTRPLLDRVLR